MKIINVIVFFALIGARMLPAQMDTHLPLNYELSKDSIKMGDEITLIFTLDIPEHWYMYSSNQDYDLGPLPAYFAFNQHKGYNLLGDIIPVGFKNKHEAVFDVDVNYFEKTAEFRQRIKICSENPVIKGFYEYQICSVLDGQCVFKNEDFEFKIQTIK